MPLAAPDSAQQQRRVDGSQDGLPTLVLARIRQAAPVQRLLFGVAGEHAEAYWHTGVQADAGETVGGGATHIVEVRSPAADDDAERDDGVVPLLRKRLRGERQLEGTRHPDDRGILDPAVGER